MVSLALLMPIISVCSRLVKTHNSLTSTVLFLERKR